MEAATFVAISKMQTLSQSNTGIAYGIGVLIAFLILSSLFYIAYTLFISELINVFNTVMIPTDNVSIDRAGSMSYLRNMWAAVPFFILIAGSLWSVIRALEMKRAEGS